MGKKKKPATESSSAGRRNQTKSPFPPQSTAYSSSKITISACEQVISDVKSNPKKSLKKIKELLSEHPSSAAVHHTQSLLHVKLASQTSYSPALKNKHLNNAVNSVKEALSLFPNSLTLNYLYTGTLVEFAKDFNDYQYIINRCWESIKANTSGVLGPGESIIASELKKKGEIGKSGVEELKELLLEVVVEKAKVESLILCGKNMTEKMKESIRFRILAPKKLRVSEEDKLLRNKQDRFEERLEVARIKEQKLRTGHVSEDGKKILATLMTRLSKKRQVLEFWKGMSCEERRGALEVRIDEIEEYYAENDHLAVEFFSEAMGFVRKMNKWKCLLCCCCHERFMEWEELRSHVLLEHLGGLSEQELELVPYGLDDWYVDEVENGVWKPVDVDNMVEELSRLNDGENDVYQEKCRFYSDQKKWLFCDDVDRQEFLNNIHLLLMLFLKNQCLAPRILSWMWDYTIQELEESIVLGFNDLLPILEQRQTPLCICFLWSEELEVVFKFLKELSNVCGLEDNPSDDKRGSKEEFCDYMSVHFSSGTSCLILDERFIRRELEHGNIVVDEGTAVIPVVENPEKDMQYDADSFVQWLFGGDEIRELLCSWKNLRDWDKGLAMDVYQFVDTEFRQMKSFCERKCRLLEYQEALTAVKNICLEEHRRREEVPEYKKQTFASLLLERQNELVDAQSDIIVNEHACVLNVMKFAQDVGRRKFGLEETLIITYSQFSDLVCHKDKETQDIKVDVCVEEAIKMEKQNIATEFCEHDVLIMKSVASIKRMEPKFVLVSGLDYQLCLFHLVKSFIRARLEVLADEEVVEKANSAETLLEKADLAPEPSKNMTEESDNLSTLRRKSKHKKCKDQGKAMDEKASAAETLLAILAHEPSNNMTEGSANSKTIRKKSKYNDEKANATEKLLVLADLASQPSKNMTEGNANAPTIRKKSKDKKHKDLGKTMDEGTGGSEEHLHLDKENVEKVNGCGSDSGITVSMSTEDLKQQEEEHRSKIGLENLNEGLEDQSHKDQRKETGGSEEQFPLCNENAEKIYTPIACGSGSLDSAMNGSIRTNNLKQEEEELRSKIGFVNLDESLEAQSQFENRTKQNYVVDINKKTDGVANDVALVHSEPLKGDGFSSHEPLKLSEAVNIPCSNIMSANPSVGQTENLENLLGVHVESEDLIIAKTPSTPSNQRTKRKGRKSFGKVKQGPSTQGVLKEGAPTEINRKLPQKSFLKQKESRKSLCDCKVNYVDGSALFGAGLKNNKNENNCFLNVIIQCLWNIKPVRNELSGISDSGHEHVGDPCIVCGLEEVFGKLSDASTSTRREAVSTSSLRIAISKWSPNKNLFQKGQMNDADELLQNIFAILHQSFTCSPSDKCLAHRLFGINISGCCCSCCITWGHQTPSPFSHYIDASQLRETKSQNQASSFVELLKLVLMRNCSTCKRGVCVYCGKPGIQFTLETPPYVFICVLDTTTAPESREDIRNTLTALDTEINIGVVYLGVGPGKKYCLVSMVCYAELHYVCFRYSHEGKRWTIYDDAYVEVIGCWHNLIDKCANKFFRPRILFFESNTFPCGDLYFGDIKCPQFDYQRKFSGRSGMLSDRRVGEVNQGPSAEGIPEQRTQCNNQNAKDGCGDLQNNGPNEMKILQEDKIRDACRVQKHVPLEREQKLPQTLFLKEERLGKYPTDLEVDYTDGSELGAGLKNDYEKQNYSSLNVIIQSLWHIPQFRNELTRKSASKHKHVGDPCVCCELAEIFSKLGAVPVHINTRRETVSPTSLSVAIDKLFPRRCLFQEGKMNNASVVLGIILESLQQALTIIQDFSLPESEKRNGVGSLECTTETCLAHALFGATILKTVNCDNCGLESRQQQCTSFFNSTVSAFELKTQVSTPIRQGTSSFNELLKTMPTNYHLAWEPDADCRCENQMTYINLQTPPHVFTSFLTWATAWVAREDISAVFAALDTEIDIQGLEQGKKYRLVSMVCYRGQLYACFIYSHEYKRWTMYDDAHVEVIGSWDCLRNKCLEKHFQPQILFFVEETASAPTTVIDEKLSQNLS